MTRARTILIGLTLALLAAGTGSAQGSRPDAGPLSGVEGDGYIIRVPTERLVLIDLGLSDGVASGDLFDIITAEILRHPLKDSILAVTPKTVGALQVKQVYERMSLAQILELETGEDPMLKPIVRVRSAERIEALAKVMARQVYRAAGQGVPLRTAVIPGIHQMQIGERRKGWALLGLETAALVGGFAYRASSNDWLRQYNALDASYPQSEFDRYFTGAQDRRGTSNRLFWLAGALYLYNWVDVLWMGGAPRLAVTAPPRTQLGLSLATRRVPLLQIRRRF